MSKINCIILEDDELALMSLQKIISGIDVLHLLGSYTNPIDAQENMDLSEVDLIFLDVEMPEISGIDFIKTLSNPPRVIVTTSRSDFAAEAFGIDAVDFILKPVLVNQVIKALQKYKQLESTDDIVPVASSATSIFVKVDSKLVQLHFRDILWVEALGDYVGFHVEGKRYVVKSTLAAIDKSLKFFSFIRVHRSFIVNVQHIKSLDDSSLIIQDKWIPVSRGYRPLVLEKIHLLK
jgi:DNA-binding LytR/AlgR family response regulator